MQDELLTIHNYYSKFYEKLSEFIDGEKLPEADIIGYNEVHLCIENILNKPKNGEVIKLTQEVKVAIKALRERELEILSQIN